MHVFVTGGAGYIGSHCCKAFAQLGWRVTVYDNISRGWRDFVKWGELIEADILDQSALDRAIAGVQPDLVVHFAALAYVGESVVDPASYYRTNVVGALNVLDAMRTNNVEKIVFSSTCATYGEPIYMPLDEAHPQAPINPYGRSKLMVERMLADYDRAYGMRHVALRYFNAAGADPEGEIGERHQPETHAIPLAIRSALDGDASFAIFGDDYDTPDGTAIRDYIHVADLADAHARAAAYLGEGGVSVALNLGTSHGYSVSEMINSVEMATGESVGARLAPRRAGDPSKLVADPSRAQAVLDWRAARTDLGEIVADAVRWERQERA